jgi:hypothetical protein
VNVYMSFAKRDGINGRSYANGFFWFRGYNPYKRWKNWCLNSKFIII